MVRLNSHLDSAVAGFLQEGVSTPDLTVFPSQKVSDILGGPQSALTEHAGFGCVGGVTCEVVLSGGGVGWVVDVCSIVMTFPVVSVVAWVDVVVGDSPVAAVSHAPLPSESRQHAPSFGIYGFSQTLPCWVQPQTIRMVANAKRFLIAMLFLQGHKYAFSAGAACVPLAEYRIKI